MKINVCCLNRECGNYGDEIGIDGWDGSQIVCGPCGGLLESQAEWHVPPVMPEPEPVEVARAIDAMPEGARAELVALLSKGV